MATDKTVSTFSPELARAIADYVRGQIGKTGMPSNAINNHFFSQKHCFAKITGSAGDSAGIIVFHSWEEVRWSFSSMDWETAPDGRSGDTDQNYLVVYPDLTTALDPDTVVLATKLEDPTTGKNAWAASSGSSAGNFKPIKVGASVNAGIYVGATGVFNDTIDTEVNLVMADVTNYDDAKSCIVVNVAESGATAVPGDIPPNTIVLGFEAPNQTTPNEISSGGDDTLRVYYTYWVKAVLDLRWNSTTHTLQVSYVHNPADEDWIDKVSFVACPDDSMPSGV